MNHYDILGKADFATTEEGRIEIQLLLGSRKAHKTVVCIFSSVSVVG